MLGKVHTGQTRVAPAGGSSEPTPLCVQVGDLVSFRRSMLTSLLGDLVMHMGGLVSTATSNQRVGQVIPGELVSKLIVRIYY